MPTARPSPPRTPDGRYLIVRGRLWRASNPALGPAERERLTRTLMQARRDVGAALRERGPPWWDDGAPDWTRRLVSNTPYAGWYATLPTQDFDEP